MDIIAKVTLVASLIMLGYNLYQLFTGYDAVCEKVKEFKQLAQDNEADETSVKRSNFLLTGVMSVAFIVLVVLANLAYWVIAVVVLKVLLTMILSHLEIVHIFKFGEIKRQFFSLTKADAIANMLVGLGIAIVVIS